MTFDARAIQTDYMARAGIRALFLECLRTRVRRRDYGLLSIGPEEQRTHDQAIEVYDRLGIILWNILPHGRSCSSDDLYSGITLRLTTLGLPEITDQDLTVLRMLGPLR